MQTTRAHIDGATITRPPIHARSRTFEETDSEITMDDMVKIVRRLTSELQETRAHLADLTSRVNFQDQVITSLRGELSRANDEGEALEPDNDNNLNVVCEMPVRCITGDFVDE